MKKRIITCVLCIALYLVAMAFSLQIQPTHAANNGTIVLTEGETKTIKLPKKQKYYTSSDSNAHACSSASYKSRKVKITGLSVGSTTVTVTSLKNKKYKYSVVVNAKPTDTSASVDSSTNSSVANVDVEVPQNVEGVCPNCKKKNHLRTAQVTYTKNAVKTGYLKEPLVSCKEFRRMRFNKALSEDEIQELVKSWHGVILSKFRDTSIRATYSNFSYDILLPCEYGGLNKRTAYETQLEIKHSIAKNECFDLYSLSDNTDNYSHYLTEWSLEEVVSEPAKKVTVNTDIIECTNCGYKFMK